MTGTHYGMIVGGGKAIANGEQAICLCVRLNDARVMRLFIEATNYLFRVNEAVSWNDDAELYWHPNTWTCHAFRILSIGQ